MQNAVTETIYIPPFSGNDPPPGGLVILFLDAVARKTNAFKELRDSILPHYNPPNAPLPEIAQWIDRWHLNFPSPELSGLIETWVFQVLDYWLTHQEDALNLLVDCGWWIRPIGRAKAGDREPLSVLMGQWNPDREGFENYANFMRSEFEKILQEQKKLGQQELDRFNMKPFRRRERRTSPNTAARPSLWNFEWLALHVCRGLSDGQIALRPEYRGVTRDVIKKARQQLEMDLKTN